MKMRTTFLKTLFSLLIICSCANLQAQSAFLLSKEGIVQANGINIAFESFGDESAETILLIQGTGAQLTAWPESLCLELADHGFRVIRYDNRDVGLSTKLDSLGMPDWASILPLIGSCDISKLPYTLQDMARDAVGLLDALKIQQAHIVGASMGGAIAQLLAINFPERTLSLTSIMASSGNPELPQGDPKVLKIMGTPPPQTQNEDTLANYLVNIYKAIGSPAYPTPDSALMEMARSNIRRFWYPAGSARQAAAVIIGDNCDRRNELKNIAIPTVVVHGKDDPVVNVAAGKEVAAMVPNAELITVPGMGHDLPSALVPTLANAILRATGERPIK